MPQMHEKKGLHIEGPHIGKFCPQNVQEGPQISASHHMTSLEGCKFDVRGTPEHNCAALQLGFSGLIEFIGDWRCGFGVHLGDNGGQAALELLQRGPVRGAVSHKARLGRIERVIRQRLHARERGCRLAVDQSQVLRHRLALQIQKSSKSLLDMHARIQFNPDMARPTREFPAFSGESLGLHPRNAQMALVSWNLLGGTPKKIPWGVSNPGPTLGQHPRSSYRCTPRSHEQAGLQSFTNVVQCARSFSTHSSHRRPDGLLRREIVGGGSRRCRRLRCARGG